jgi:hypothetical protein
MKDFNADAHSHVIISDGTIIEIGGEKFLVTKVEQDEQVKPVIDLHKDSWGVLNDGSQRFKDTVIKWLNEHAGMYAQGRWEHHYYGILDNGTQLTTEDSSRFTHILTLDEFCALAYPREEVSEWTNKHMNKEHLGKWARCIADFYGAVKDSWYQFQKSKDNDGYGYLNEDVGVRMPERYFDMNNLLDYNPETLVGKYYQGNTLDKIIYEDNVPKFYTQLGDGYERVISCCHVDPSDVTGEPPLKSLKYEDCFKRVKPSIYLNAGLEIIKSNQERKDGLATKRQAKQAAAMLQLMTICHDANGGDWIPNEGEKRTIIEWEQEFNQISIDIYECTFYSPIYFRDAKTAQRAYEANKEIFHAYFGING